MKLLAVYHQLYDAPVLQQEYERALAALREAYQCGHLETDVRCWRRGDAKRFYLQCLRCGRKVRDVPRKEIACPDVVPILDAHLQQDYLRDKALAEAELYLKFQQRAVDEGVIFEAGQKAEYEAYINSQAWAARRQRVLDRDNWLCQACLENTAEHVHHLTYDHLGDELLFELISVCRKCHERIHARRFYYSDGFMQDF